jgi:hypothetical protein
MASEARAKRLAAWGLALALLVLGAAAGVAVDRLLLQAGRPGRAGPPSPEEMLDRMTHDLGLSDAQAQAALPILEERQRALATLFERVEPDADRIRRDASDRIRALLDPGQRERFEARLREAERRRSELRARLGRAPAPGRGP